MSSHFNSCFVAIFLLFFPLATVSICTLNAPVAINDDLQLEYCVENGKITMQFELSSAESVWIGVAISNDAFMPVSDAVIGQPASGDNLAEVKKFSLVSRAWPSVLGSEAQDLEDESVVYDAVDGKVKLAFTRLVVPGTGDTAGSEIEITSESYLLWAVGFTESLGGHGSRGSVKINFLDADEAVEIVDEDELKVMSLQSIKIHGMMMAAAWLILIPTSVMVARYGKAKFGGGKGAWIRFHRICGGLTLVLTAVGYIMARTYHSQSDSQSDSDSHGHSQSGVGIARFHKPFGLFVVFFGGVVLPMLGVLRPHATKEGEKKKKKRFVWEIIHKNLGRIVVILALINCISGPGILASTEPVMVGSGVGFVLATGLWFLTSGGRRGAVEPAVK